MSKNTYRYLMFEATFLFTPLPLPYHADEDLWQGPPSEDPSRIDAWVGVGSTTRARGRAPPCNRRAALVLPGDFCRRLTCSACRLLSPERPARHREEGPASPPHRLARLRRSYYLPPLTSPTKHSSAAAWNPGSSRERAGAVIEGWLGGRHRPSSVADTWLVCC